MGNILGVFGREDSQKLQPTRSMGEFCSDDKFFIVRSNSLGSLLSDIGDEVALDGLEDEEELQDEPELPPLFDA